MADPSLAYSLFEELGSGSFGTVYKAIEKATGELVAIKHIDLDGSDDDINDIQQEIALLSTCASSFVTKYKTSFVRGAKLWIVMEFLGGGSCHDLIKIAPFSEAQAAVLCRELLLGLTYLHGSGKIHRDIKAANVLLSTTGRVKIADFGVAAQLTNMKSQRMTFVGTPYWMAPEVIQESGYDFKADIWSLGITAMEFVLGDPPNNDIHPMKALFHIPKAPSPRLDENSFSREIRSFVAACLIKDPDRRPTAKELLQHRFIQRAGRVESLRDLIRERKEMLPVDLEQSHPRYYEETLRDMSAPSQNDDWVFDTVKPKTMARPVVHTMKKRKLSEAAAPMPDIPIEEFMQMDINEPTPPPSPQKEELDENTTLEQAMPDHTDVKSEASRPMSRQVSQLSEMGTVQRRPAVVGTARRVSNSVRKVSSPARRASVLNHSPAKQPLALDMSFGNGVSTTRQFRRVSDESPILQHAPVNNENVPPAVDSYSKEGKLGRRLFAKVVDPAFQEVYAHTATRAKQEALSQLEQAWAALDAVDPEGSLLLFKTMLEKMQNEPKLGSMVQPAASVSNTPQKPKLVLAQNNPHLKSHRRRQSSQVSFISAVAERPVSLPVSTEPGMEHTKQLADVLYGRWAEGLRTRWT